MTVESSGCHTALLRSLCCATLRSAGAACAAASITDRLLLPYNTDAFFDSFVVDGFGGHEILCSDADGLIDDDLIIAFPAGERSVDDIPEAAEDIVFCDDAVCDWDQPAIGISRSPVSDSAASLLSQMIFAARGRIAGSISRRSGW